MAETVLLGGPVAKTGSNQCSLPASVTEDELFTARILVDLRYAMDLVATAPEPKWGRKRRRSCLSDAVSSVPAPKTTNVEMKSQVKTVEKDAAASAEAATTVTASPVTPLAFPPSESDERPRRTIAKRTSKKKSTQEYIAMLEDLTRSTDLLRKNIENKTKHYSELKAKNSQLKAIKQQVLNSCPMKEEPDLERTIGMNLGLELITRHHRMGVAPHPQPLVTDRTAENIRTSLGPNAAQMESYNGLGIVGPVGSNGIPDLNISADRVVIVEASQLLDLADRRARSAEARRRRKGIMKIKVMRGACRVSLAGVR